MKKYLSFLLLISLLSCTTDKQNNIHDIVIIGGGLMGSSSAWHLTNTGHNVLLIEKQDSVYTQGSSYGEARIARSNNRGNDIWSYLHNRSLKETKVLIDFLNKSGDGSQYKMEDIYTTSPVTYVGRIGIYDKLFASLKRQKVDYDMAITPAEGASKFNVQLPDSVLIQREYNQHSGMVNPKTLITYLHQAVKQKGSQINYNTKVIDLKYNSEKKHYEIQTQSEKTGETHLIRTQKIVSAAGPYTGQLLKNVAPYFDDLINPQRVFLAFFKIKENIYRVLSADHKEKLQSYYPVINSSKGTRAGSFFSMIEYYDYNKHPVIKVGGHFQRSAIDDLDQVWRKQLTAEEIEWSQNSTAAYFKLLNIPVTLNDLELVKGYSCVYSLTENEVPFITPIPNEDNSPNNNCIVMGGMSGVGAKGAMTYGLIAADLINETTQTDSLHLVTAKALGFDRLLTDLRKSASAN